MKAVIIYLSRSQDLNDLLKSVKLLYRNFNNKYNYPVIIFNDDFSSNEKNKVIKINPNIKFENLKFELPPWINLNKPFKTKWSVSYRHMCRFFGGEIYKLSIMKNYDWYWRLDSDSFIYSEIKYDIFKFMEKEGYVYGYIGKILKDGPHLVEGLWDLTKEYIQNKNIKPKFLNNYLDSRGIYDNSLYYTNFEISKLDFWKSNEYMDYYNCIDYNGGIFYNRWGDHIIHFLALSMFIDKKKIHCFKDIDYSHHIFRPNKNYRFYTLLKKYNVQNKSNKYLINIKQHKLYSILNLYIIPKLIDFINYFLNYNLIKLKVYCNKYN